ncbi:MAG TPA: hypothetical protein VL463_28205 [Kofleriaceae bacterium]|nr:hypothetical protein [Kofleriaceae bacterium]
MRRILLASAVFAGASACGHKSAQASPPPAEDPKTDPTDPNGPSGPTPPEAPGDQAVPMQPKPPVGSGSGTAAGGDEGSNKGGAGSAPRDAGVSAPADGGAPRGNPRDGGVRSY